MSRRPAGGRAQKDLFPGLEKVGYHQGTRFGVRFGAEQHPLHSGPKVSGAWTQLSWNSQPQEITGAEPGWVALHSGCLSISGPLPSQGHQSGW